MTDGDLQTFKALARTHRVPRDAFAEQLSAALFAVIAEVEHGRICDTHGDPLICLACEQEETQIWRDREPDVARLREQALTISSMLADAGIGPCSLPEGVLELVRRLDAALAAALAPHPARTEEP